VYPVDTNAGRERRLAQSWWIGQKGRPAFCWSDRSRRTALREQPHNYVRSVTLALKQSAIFGFWFAHGKRLDLFPCNLPAQMACVPYFNEKVPIARAENNIVSCCEPGRATDALELDKDNGFAACKAVFAFSLTR